MINKTLRNIANVVLLIFGLYPSLYILASLVCTGNDTYGGISQCPVQAMTLLLTPGAFIYVFYVSGGVLLALLAVLISFGLSTVYELQQALLSKNFFRFGILIPIASMILFFCCFGLYIARMSL